MLTKISDYKLAASCLKRLCRAKGFSFKDIEVDFDQSLGVNSGRICIGKSKNIGHTIYLIISTYIDNSKDILGCDLFIDEKTKENFLIHQATLLRRIIYVTNLPKWDEGKSDGIFMQRLYQKPLIWTLMRNIICPLTECSIKNVAIVTGGYPYIDVAHYFKEGEIDEEKLPKEEFIFCNDSVSNEAVSNAHMLVESIRAHNLSPMEVIKNILDADLFARIAGAVKIALLDDESIDEFSTVLFEILDISQELLRNKDIVTAQSGAGPYSSSMQWWYNGLTEKMLEPVRGYNWSTYEALHEHNEKFWDEVEKIRSKKPQGEGVVFNDLLRLNQLHSIDMPIDTSRPIQSMLASQRIW